MQLQRGGRELDGSLMGGKGEGNTRVFGAKHAGAHAARSDFPPHDSRGFDGPTLSEGAQTISLGRKPTFLTCPLGS